MYSNYFKSLKYLDSIKDLPLKDYMKDKRVDPIIYIKRTEYLLNLLDNPQKDFKFIHVTGTSGKGSTCSLIHNILTQAKFKAGLFLSPHTTTIIQRIKVGDKYISPNQFANLTNFLKPYILECHENSPYGRPSYFEIILALVLLYFKQQKCKYVVLEVGCGGMYDATNVIPRSKISIITNIDLEHTRILGKTLTAIAKDKAGIIKHDSYFITKETRLKILKIFKDVCRKKKTKFIQIQPEIEEIKHTLDGTYFKFRNNPQKYFSGLIGKHQVYNSAIAIEVAKKLKIPNKHILAGLKKTKLPCRFEVIKKKPLIILDGAHNPAKMKSLTNNLKHLEYERLCLIIGIKEKKDKRRMLKQIIPYTDKIFVASVKKGMQDKQYLQKFKKSVTNIDNGLKPKIFFNPRKALDQALKEVKAKDLILVTGSLYLTGEIREKWFLENYILKNRKSF